MSANVFLVRVADWKNRDHLSECFARLLKKLAPEYHYAADDLVGIKITFGEQGNLGHPPADLIRQLAAWIAAQGGKPFVTETNTLYRGQRQNAVDHLNLARSHGFTHETIGAPIILSDGVLGRDSYVHDPQGDPRHLAPAIRDMDALVDVAHMTGHMVEGFGGVIKNLGMGLASRAGKLDQHSMVSPAVDEKTCVACGACIAVCPVNAITMKTKASIDGEICYGCAECLAVCPPNAIKIDWSAETAYVMKRTAAYAAAIMERLKQRVCFISLLNHITTHCDCLGDTGSPLIPDIGIVASSDPVALDQASIDLVNEMAGEDLLKREWPNIDYNVQLDSAVALGLGTREYTVTEL
jgi:uncharacterized protein